MIWFPLLAAVLALAATPLAAAPVTDAQIIAVAQPEQQLEVMLAANFFQNPAGPKALYALGLPAGCDALRRSVANAVAGNRAAWSANVLAAYRGAVPADKLSTIVALPPEQAAPLLDPLRPDIGTRMRASSEALLEAAATKVVADLTAAAAPVDVTKIDRAARGRELAAAQPTGAQFCGLLPPAMIQGDAPPPPAR